MFGGRIGGRIASQAIIKLNDKLNISVMSTHLESGTGT